MAMTRVTNFTLLFFYRFGRSGKFAVVCSPTDQGYYEPDTSALIRLKMASEYGYGINPATVLTDKVNILGTGAHPFWRWLEGNCRTPAGIGKIQVSGMCMGDDYFQEVIP
jgi:glutathione peroxidase-family protein